jgi:hypothetical protein
MKLYTAAETEEVLSNLDAAMAAYTASIDRGLILASWGRQLADTIDNGSSLMSGSEENPLRTSRETRICSFRVT